MIRDNPGNIDRLQRMPPSSWGHGSVGSWGVEHMHTWLTELVPQLPPSERGHSAAANAAKEQGIDGQKALLMNKEDWIHLGYTDMRARRILTKMRHLPGFPQG